MSLIKNFNSLVYIQIPNTDEIIRKDSIISFEETEDKRFPLKIRTHTTSQELPAAEARVFLSEMGFNSKK